MSNPEQDVIDAIGALVDEQLAAGIHDDYNANYYPRCPGCHHEWHGIKCECCRCPTSEGVERARCDINFSIEGQPWAIYHPERDEVELGNLPHGGPRGHTIADLEAMRRAPWDYPRPFEAAAMRQVQFWRHDELHNTWHVVEGRYEVLRYDLNRSRIAVTIRLDPCRIQVIADEDMTLPRDIPEDMIGMGGGDGFELLAPEDIEFAHQMIESRHVFRECHEATIRFDARSALVERVMEGRLW